MTAHSRVREFWRHRGVGNAALLPLAGAYRLGWHLRAWHLRRQARPLPVPVVVVGCLTAGGGGKTTVVEALATGLASQGLAAGIIARGHGGKATGPVLVAADADPGLVGDEPAMLAASLDVPVAVGVDRLAAARTLLAHHPDTAVLISDDGLQHLRLPRQFEIIALSGYGLGNGWLLPAGPLREPARRLATVDAIVRTDNPQPGEETVTFGAPRLYDAGNEEMPASALAGRQVWAIAGIAEPGRFFADVEAAGITLAGTRAFADHHRYRHADLAAVPGERIVMTAKDAIKCRRLGERRLVEVRRLPRLGDALLNRIVDRVHRFQPA